MQLCPADKLIVALDGMKPSDVGAFLDNLPQLKWVKVGLELFAKGGPEIITEIKDRGLSVFLDLKFHDIPVTMANASRYVASLGVDLLTVHACAGVNALTQAKLASLEGAHEKGFSPPKILAVTVLTSWNQEDFSQELCIDNLIQNRVELLANLAVKAGLGGCICSPKELLGLRKFCPETFELVTPGIRLRGGSMDDQARVLTPKDAINLGASRLVIGRPITQSVSPRMEFLRFCNDLNES